MTAGRSRDTFLNTNTSLSKFTCVTATSRRPTFPPKACPCVTERVGFEIIMVVKGELNDVTDQEDFLVNDSYESGRRLVFETARTT